MSEEFVHRFVPGEKEDGPTILALHGTGGNEDDLLPLARELAPGAAVLSPRGKVLEFRAPRYFRRLAEGVFDHEDLALRTQELAGFVEACAKRYGFDAAKLVALGYSNGANIAASLMLSRPEVLRAAVLFRAMVPFEPEESGKVLRGVPVLICAGSLDRLVPAQNTARLEEILASRGAQVDLRWKKAGHGLTYEEVGEAGKWLSGVLLKLGG